MPKQSKGYAQQPNIQVQNSFIGGLKTEFTGLNFPENACTSVNNCVFTLVGDVLRREGIDVELNGMFNSAITTNSVAISSYRWKDAGGIANFDIVVIQAGLTLYFFASSNSSVAMPLSNQQLASTVNISTFLAPGSDITQLPSTECQYASGNGYLFVYNSACDPFFCTFNPNGSTINPTPITLQIRDFLGYYPETGNPSITLRPTSLTSEHQYNLENQGWTGAPSWSAQSSTNFFSLSSLPALFITVTANLGAISLNVSPGISNIVVSQPVNISWSCSVNTLLTTGQHSSFQASGGATGTVIAYDSVNGILTLSVTTSNSFTQNFSVLAVAPATISGPFSTIDPGLFNNTISTFFSDEGLYPSNSDVWFAFKDSSGIFNPSAVYGSVPVTTTPAPRGHFILNVFAQNQSTTPGAVTLSTTSRPSTGCWFQGRVWYTGVNSSSTTSDGRPYTWTENIYFSQVIDANDVVDFGNCYQTNDPTDDTTFELLPTDGGVITIQGAGTIHKIFPTQNGIFVFANNGVWFVTGNSGLGFTANDYRIDRISAIKTLTSHSFVDVLGLPYFWNEEGIYEVQPVQGNIPYGHGGFTVQPITIGTIKTFYNSIPLDSKRYARGDYNPVTYVLQWIYRSTQESGISNRYIFNSALNLNLQNKAFYPYTISSISTTPFINGIFYLDYPNSGTAPAPAFKYICSFPPGGVTGTSQQDSLGETDTFAMDQQDDSFSAGTNAMSFAEERDNVSWLDWNSISGQNYVSSFSTGYSMPGQFYKRFQPVYLYMYYRSNGLPSAYQIFSTFNFASSPDSGKVGNTQLVTTGLGNTNYQYGYRKHKLRGHGNAMQFTVTSVQGQPFDFIGWAIPQMINMVD